jgi:serine phosphatase RsbU (regulator of sigma subunit)/pSer/pThr/pTyr-binding forkhead associated (FHA) protein
MDDQLPHQLQTGTTKGPRAHPSRLVIEKGEHAGMVFPLRDAVVSIGRGPENTIQIIDARMSRNHSLIVFNDGAWFVRDQGSKNGTVLNNELIANDRALTHGDSVQIGDTVFVFEQEQRRLVDATGHHSTGLRVMEDDGVVQASAVFNLRDQFPDLTQIGGRAPGSSGDAERLSILYQVADMMSSILDLDVLLDHLVDLIQRYLEPDRVGILLYDEHFDIMLPKVIRRPVDSTEDIVISNAIITRAVTEQAAVLVTDAPHDLRFKASDSVAIQRIQSAICAPLLYKNEGLGVLYLDRRRPLLHYKEEDLKLVALIAHEAALAIANSRLHQRLLEQHAHERELQIARSIQEHLLPREMPELPGFEIAGLSHAAKSVGGDYFDVITLRDGRVLLVIADVSGKGVPAAILLASVRAAVQVESRDLTPGTLMTLVDRLNHMICRDSANNMFVTMLLAILDPATRELTYCNAGHVHPMLRHPDGQITSLETGGCFLGIMPGMPFEEGRVTLPLDSVLLMYTDGVTDTMNEQREMFGTQRLVDSYHAHYRLSAPEFCKRIDAVAGEFRKTADAFDDFTLLVLKILAAN